MKRLLRIILNALTVLSLILLVATVALWVRGYWRGDEFGWVQAARPNATRFFFAIDSGGGGLGVRIGFVAPWIVSSWPWEGWEWRREDQPPIQYAGGWVTNRWGFACKVSPGPKLGWAVIVLPTWVATAIFVLLPATRLALAFRRRRVREECCEK